MKKIEIPNNLPDLDEYSLEERNTFHSIREFAKNLPESNEYLKFSKLMNVLSVSELNRFEKFNMDSQIIADILIQTNQNLLKEDVKKKYENFKDEMQDLNEAITYCRNDKEKSEKESNKIEKNTGKNSNRKILSELDNNTSSNKVVKKKFIFF